MKRNAFLMTSLVSSLVMLFTSVQATNLNGLWRNQRQNITIRIEQDQSEGFRAKRIDHGVWYRYTLKNDDVYVDRHGNSYEIMDQDEIAWREAGTNGRLLFYKISDGTREDRLAGQDIRTNAFEGHWIGQSLRDRLEIRENNGEFQVRSSNSNWEKFYSDRNGSRIRSRSGATILMIDRDKIKVSFMGRNERTYVRDHSYDHHRDDRYGRNGRDDRDDRYRRSDRGEDHDCHKKKSRRTHYDNGRHLGHYKNGKRS
jgi:hypothetical protein